MTRKIAPNNAPDQGARLSVSNLTIQVRDGGADRTLVDGLSFELQAGEILAIAGESGSGKSLTSLAIMGLMPKSMTISDGAIHLAGRDITHLPESQRRALRGDRIAMIFQEPMTSLNPVLTIGAQLVEAIQAHRIVSRKAARAQALEALQAVRLSQPERRLKQYPHELSGGMRQRVMIAMALALEPDVLIADEPTTALDVTVQREILDLLRDLQTAHGTSIVLITHDMGVVAEMADRVIVVRAGQVVEAAPVQTLFDAPKAAYTKALLAAAPRMGDGSGKRAADWARRRSTDAAPVARLVDAQVRFDIRGGLFSQITHKVHAVEKVTFSVHPGETLALVGESGCGKSTIAKALVGLTPYSGGVEVCGAPVAGRDAAGRRSLARDAQIIFQDPMAALDPRMTVGDLVMEPLVIHGLGDAKERQGRAADMFERVGLSPDQMQRYPHEFSGGQRQRICIARALALRPKMIIADESVSALDVSVQAQVLDLLDDLKAELGIALLFISHDMAVVENISDRVAVMYLGQIVETGTRAQVFGAPRHPYTQRLIDAAPIPDPHHVRPPVPRMSGEVPSPIHPVGHRPELVKMRHFGEGHFAAV